MATGLKLSVEEYLALPEDESREYIDAEVVPKVAADFKHMIIVHFLDRLLGNYCETHGGLAGPEGRIELTFQSRTDYRLPDLSYWARGRRFLIGRIMAPPTLAIEVQSPGQGAEFLRQKCRDMRAGGVDVCWLFLPDRRLVEVYEGAFEGTVLGEGDILATEAMPGFSVPVDDVYAAWDGIEGTEFAP